MATWPISSERKAQKACEKEERHERRRDEYIRQAMLIIAGRDGDLYLYGSDHPWADFALHAVLLGEAVMQAADAYESEVADD